MGNMRYSHLLVAFRVILPMIAIPHLEKGYRVANYLVEKVVYVEGLHVFSIFSTFVQI